MVEYEVYRWFILIIVLINYRSIEGKTFFVSDYGAYPNDNLDDTNAIQRAIDEAAKDRMPREIAFGPGIYTIFATIFITNASDLTVRGAGIDQTFLIAYNQVAILHLLYSERLTLTALSIDYDPLPFTAGYVVNVNDTYIDVQVVPPHQTDVDRQIRAILRYDPVHMRPAFGPNAYEIYQVPPPDVNTTIISPGVLRLPIAHPAKFRQGDPVVARYATRDHAIFALAVVDLTIQSIKIYASWSMGFVTVSTRRLNVIDYHLLPRNGRWMSSSQDCMHFIDTREFVSISDSECRAMGDDGLNVHAVFFLVTAVMDSQTVIIQSINRTGPIDIGVGTNVEISSHLQPFIVHGTGNVSSLVFNSTGARVLTFTGPVNISLDDWVCVSDTPLLTIRNFTVANNRARGVLLETRNIDIRQSVFDHTSGPAVLIQPSLYWHEGPEARNVSLIENVYIENNQGLAQAGGIITILPDPIQLIPAINDLRIESSTFYMGQYSQTLLRCDNANDLFISGNYIATNNSSPLISICNSRNVSADHNCVVNLATKIDQYYTYDSTYPCSMSLSSLIDLPPSAFNSSFPPPVMRKD